MFSTEDIIYYIFALVVICVVIYLIRKFASCLIKTAITLIVIAALVWFYLTYMQQ